MACPLARRNTSVRHSDHAAGGDRSSSGGCLALNSVCESSGSAGVADTTDRCPPVRDVGGGYSGTGDESECPGDVLGGEPHGSARIGYRGGVVAPPFDAVATLSRIPGEAIGGLCPGTVDRHRTGQRTATRQPDVGRRRVEVATCQGENH